MRAAGSTACILVFLLGAAVAKKRPAGNHFDTYEEGDGIGQKGGGRGLLELSDWFTLEEINNSSYSPLTWIFAPTPDGGFAVRGFTYRGFDANGVFVFLQSEFAADDYMAIISGHNVTGSPYLCNMGCVKYSLNGSDPGVAAYLTTKEGDSNPETGNLTARPIDEMAVLPSTNITAANDTQLFKADFMVQYTAWVRNWAEDDQNYHLSLSMHPPGSGICDGILEEESKFPTQVTTIVTPGILIAGRVYNAHQITGASCIKYSFKYTANGSIFLLPPRITSFFLTSANARKYEAPTYYDDILNEVELLGQCVINDTTPKTCTQTISNLDVNELHHLYYKDQHIPLLLESGAKYLADSPYELSLVALGQPGASCDDIDLAAGKISSGESSGRSVHALTAPAEG